MGQGPPEIATGVPKHSSTVEKEDDNEAPRLLWQRYARQSSPASDVFKQENALQAVTSESALLPVVDAAPLSALP
jgi:hypothetical protein